MTISIVFLMLISGFLIFIGVWPMFVSESESDFAKADGVLLRHELTSEAAVNIGSDPRRAGFQWVLRVEYKYIVDGKEFVGSNLSNVSKEGITYDKKDKEGNKTPPERLVNMEKKLEDNGKTVVYHSKNNHDYSFLFFEERSKTQGLLFLFLGLLMFIGCVATLTFTANR